MDSFFYKEELVGIRIGSFPTGTRPATDETYSLQLLTIKQPQGTLVKPHVHKPVTRHTLNLQECLIVKKGKIKIFLYGPDKKIFRRILLKQGQAYITISGGHSMEFLEDSEIYEIKNGPFKEDKELI